jgi:O-antigen/teichoic acid export membrane protein
LIASNNQKQDLKINIISMACNIGLNLLFIPRFSFLGAGLATLLSICIFSALQYRFISSNLFKINFRETIKPILASIIMGLIIFFLRNFHLFFLIPIALLIYILGLLALKSFSQNDITLIYKLFEKEKSSALDNTGI